MSFASPATLTSYAKMRAALASFTSPCASMGNDALFPTSGGSPRASRGKIPIGDAVHAMWMSLPLLSITDLFVEKLLANSDRGADSDELARDLVDLAILRLAHGPIPEASWAHAEGAYLAAPRLDLRRAAERFLADANYQARCFARLGVERGDDVLRGVDALLVGLGTTGSSQGWEPRAPFRGGVTSRWTPAVTKHRVPDDF